MSEELMAKFIEEVIQEASESDETTEQEREWSDCPRCKTKNVIWTQDWEPECGRCESRDTEERKAWVAFASARLAFGDTHEACSVPEASSQADMMLEEFRARFPYPAKPEVTK